MGREIDLTAALPQSKRNIAARAEAKDPEVVRISKEYGEAYFDGDRAYGYGGYRYDGRWVPVARDVIAHYDLGPGDRILDVGCAKGFLVKDLLDLGVDAFGLDVSRYAVRHGHPDVAGRLHVGSADALPFADGAFAAAVSINTIHNLPRERAGRALSELMRVSGGRCFVKVDSYHSPEQKSVFESWALTAEFHDYPDGWRALFDDVGYSGDYAWTVVG